MSDTAASFKLFNETTHPVCARNAKGEVAVYWGDQNGLSSPRPISFQVETTGVGVIPLSFGSPSNTQWTDDQKLRQPSAEFDGSVREDTVNTTSVSFGLSGEFHTKDWRVVLIFDSRGKFGEASYLDNLQIGLQEISRLPTMQLTLLALRSIILQMT